MDQSVVEITGWVSEERVRAGLEHDVRKGLGSSPKKLPSKYFYDQRGSELFDEITRVEEYYPTRCEAQVLEQHAEVLLRDLHPLDLIEIGAGFSRKTQALIEHLQPTGLERLVGTDVSEDALRGAAHRFQELYPNLDFRGVVADFEHDFPDIARQGKRLIAFLGSTFGNFEVADRHPFLRRIKKLMAPGDAFLLGVDLVKEKGVLEAAYNDARGITAEFNRNVLHVLNRELKADFPVQDFEHRAFYSHEDQRIEMWLVASRALEVHVGDLDLTVAFEAGEAMRTEISCKFTRTSIEAELGQAGLALQRWIPDRQGYFGLGLATLE